MTASSPWATTPRPPALLPEATDGHPKGDKNSNGRLDAGDLILNFSDGVDDDANGYIDDISGWDFMKNDNDPYDDTRYGHGTGEADDSAAAANNGIGGAGVCPQCRFIPTRVGDSFITDVNDFAQGRRLRRRQRREASCSARSAPSTATASRRPRSTTPTRRACS